MIDAAHAVQSTDERGCVPKVAFNLFYREVFDSLQPARGAHQNAHHFAARYQLPGHVAPEEPCGAGDQRGHKIRKRPSEDTKSVWPAGGMAACASLECSPPWPLP